MRLGLCLSGLLLAAPSWAGSEAGHDAHDALVPEVVVGASERALWARADGWRLSDTQVGDGTRVAMLVDVADAGPSLVIEVRGVDGATVGPWLPVDETFRGAGQRVGVVDLGQAWSGAQLRIAEADEARVGALAWELLVPRYPEAGARARAAASAGVPIALDPFLSLIGVVDRGMWGARPTGCTSLEDDWYRMAIHHTAGTQTSGGTVQGAVQALQAYAQDSGTYCDIPYQFLVGFDGSLLEGRPLDYLSGATGGGNNDGNVAVCFLGCYHPSSCPYGAGDPATVEMIDGAQLLIQTLVELHGIPSDASTIMGHRDYPDNATACPGDYVVAELDTLRTNLAWFGGQEVARSAPGNPVQLAGAPGEQLTVWVELVNTGGLYWTPGTTFLGTTGPRDGASPLATSAWPAPNRAATVAALTAPGETGRFSFSARVPESGAITQSFGLVEEWVTWFADVPWGGGPGDDLLVVTVSAQTDDGGGSGTDDPGTTGPTDPPGNALTASSGRVPASAGGCGCRTVAAPGGWLGLAAAGWALRRRRGRGAGAGFR